MDRLKLEYAIKKKKLTYKEVCEALNISRSAFYRKSRGISEFTQSEISILIDLLDLENPCEIFFANNVS